MPVAVKFSRKFYEKFGEDFTNELVDMVNNVDAIYRANIKDIIEPQFAAFEAKFSAFEARFAAFEARSDQKLAELHRDITIEISQSHTALLRWMFAFWVPSALGILGTAVAVVALFIRK